MDSDWNVAALLDTAIVGVCDADATSGISRDTTGSPLCNLENGPVQPSIVMQY